MKTQKLLLVLSVCFLSLGCSSTIKRVQNNIQHKKNLENIAQRFAYKYKGQCSKEAYQYFPVDNPTVKKYGDIVKFEPQKTATCTKYGNQIECKDTTPKSFFKNPDVIVDINLNARSSHLRGCIKEALKQDDGYLRALSQEKVRHSNTQSFINEKPRKQYKQTYLGENIDSDSKPWDWNSKQESNSTSQKTVTLQLSDFNRAGGNLYCYYGEDNRPRITDANECPKFQTFEL